MMRLAVAALIGMIGAASASAGCSERVVDLRGPNGMSRFSVEIADTPETRARGLMNRTGLAAGAGMLFLFDPPRETAFWMKNTPLPLDLIFIGQDGVVGRVAANATPYSEEEIPSGGVVRAVLEINGGLAAQLGIAQGSEVRHPALDQSRAAWPCG
jgi:uncharacterized protein